MNSLTTFRISSWLFTRLGSRCSIFRASSAFRCRAAHGAMFPPTGQVVTSFKLLEGITGFLFCAGDEGVSKGCDELEIFCVDNTLG